MRIGLWTGEEQGLIGSALYVQAALRRRPRRARRRRRRRPTPEHAKFAGYFNIDNGTGAIRGVYLQQNQAVGADLPRVDGAVPQHRDDAPQSRQHGRHRSPVVRRDRTCPGFQFIQDEIEYDTMTHHTNLDSYERLQPEDMRRNATIAAAFAFLAANREEKLPRKPAGAGRRAGGN